MLESRPEEVLGKFRAAQVGCLAELRCWEQVKQANRDAAFAIALAAAGLGIGIEAAP